MLNFVDKPDFIFNSILEGAFDMEIDYLKDMGQQELDDLPNASKVFSVELAIETLEKLRVCHKSSDVYDLNDYHYVLIYDALEARCQFLNEMADEKDYELVKGTKIINIDFCDLISTYFPDVDFLVPKKKILSSKWINRLDFRLETLGVILGLEAYPTILENKLLKEGEYAFDSESKEPPMFTPESTEYPDYFYYRDEKLEEALAKNPPPKNIVYKSVSPNWNRL